MEASARGGSMNKRRCLCSTSGSSAPHQGAARAQGCQCQNSQRARQAAAQPARSTGTSRHHPHHAQAASRHLLYSPPRAGLKAAHKNRLPGVACLRRCSPPASWVNTLQRRQGGSGRDAELSPALEHDEHDDATHATRGSHAAPATLCYNQLLPADAGVLYTLALYHTHTHAYSLAPRCLPQRNRIPVGTPRS